MDKELILKALRHHDGHSLMPEWTWEDQMALTRALDELRKEWIWIDNTPEKSWCVPD